MILGDPAHLSAAGPAARATLDVLFRHAATRRPDSVALCDPPHRESIDGRRPQRLTYAQCDRLISALATRLQRTGLPRDSIVGIQLGNVAEHVLTLLAVLRAGMIASPMPLLWRRADCVAALSQIGAKAFITATRIGESDHATLAMDVAADMFAIRHVFAFGRDVPDGLIALDEVFDDQQPVKPIFPDALDAHPAAHIAIVTFDVTAQGMVAVARNHMELVASGRALLHATRLGKDTAILATPMPSSFAGLSLTLMPWLSCGGTLMLHHGFDREAFARQIAERPPVVVMPGPVAVDFAQAGIFKQSTKMVLGLWHAPERQAHAASWPLPEIACLDALAFGETGILVAARGSSRKPASFSCSPSLTMHETGMSALVERVRLDGGTLGLRGPMVPRHAFPPGIERTRTLHFEVSADGFADTGYACRVDASTRTMTITSAPAALIGIGAYRFNANELQELVKACPGDGTLMAVPDGFAGQRLAGHARDHAALREALEAFGFNPLIAGAFREQNHQPSAA